MGTICTGGPRCKGLLDSEIIYFENIKIFSCSYHRHRHSNNCHSNNGDIFVSNEITCAPNTGSRSHRENMRPVDGVTNSDNDTNTEYVRGIWDVTSTDNSTDNNAQLYNAHTNGGFRNKTNSFSVKDTDLERITGNEPDSSPGYEIICCDLLLHTLLWLIIIMRT